MNKFIITRVPVPDQEKTAMIGALFQKERLESVSCYAPAKDNLNHIYIGRVDSIAENIHAFFVRISKDELCFVPYEEVKFAVFTRKLSKKELAVGDELLVQVNRLPLKTKQASATTRICLSGQYVAVTYGSYHLGVSNKISLKRKKELKELLEQNKHLFHELNLIARTNCEHAQPEQILEEAARLSGQLVHLVQTAVNKTLYSCLYRPEPRYIRDILNSYEGEIEEIVTDLPQIQEEIRQALNPKNSGTCPKLRFYEDSYPLYQLFSLEKEIREILSRKVWLKSGAYLIIDPTEALTVIDVNSGKNIRKGKDDYYLKVNLEAAQEIARQIRLRNLSGICIVDFIDLEKEEQREELLHFMKEQCRKDHIPTTVVDMTKLHLMEITRKKTDPTFFEQIFHDFS